MSRCYGCCQENCCGREHCDCSCHAGEKEAEKAVEAALRSRSNTEREIWNEAIETAVIECEREARLHSIILAGKIRKLKKEQP